MKRPTNKELEANVRRGVRYLDKNHPGWAEKIDLKTLNLVSTSMCVLGQVFGSFWDALRYFADGDDVSWAIRHGFNAPGADIDEGTPFGTYERLGLTWAPYIAIRQVKAAAAQRLAEA